MIQDKRILFVTDSCPPNLTMSGVVMKKIIDYLADTNSFDIVALRQGDNDVSEYLGCKVYYVKSFPYYILSRRAKGRNSRGAITRIRYKVVTMVFRLGSILMRIASPVGLNIITQRKLKDQIGHVLREKRYDYVLCNAKPFESFEAALPYISMYPDTRFIAYQTDDFVTSGDERYMPRTITMRNHKNRVKRINEYVAGFSAYGFLESVYKKEIDYINDKAKVKSLGIPLLYERETGKRKPNMSEVLRFVYTGSLVKAYRPPNGCLDILMEVAQQKRILVDLYHRGDCDDVINMYAKRSKGVICNKGTVSLEESYSAIESADILISISNTAGDQISGKTFDYISTCKPIIHFYYDEKDMNANVLKKYPLCLCIMMTDETIDHSKRIIEFADHEIKQKVLFRTLLASYSKYTVESVVGSLFYNN